MIIGYVRTSTNKQCPLRQERNILTKFPNAKIVKETYTGTKTIGREKFNYILNNIQAGDTVVFDSVSRMSRNAEEGVQQYMELYDKDVNLVFLKEGYINTDTYRKQIESIDLPVTDNNIVDAILDGVRNALMEVAKENIRIAFEQSEKEVKDLQQRTREGIESARRKGKQIGLEKGTKLVTKKSIDAKEKIKKHSRDFGGTLNDKEVMMLCKIARNSYYKYKKELIEEL